MDQSCVTIPSSNAISAFFQKTLEDSLMIQFAPTVDGEFLLDHPTTMLQREGTLYDDSTGNRSVPVPIMVGVTRDELEVWMTKC